MKVSNMWLRERVDITNSAIDAESLASMLTMAGLEVDAVNPVAGIFDGVVVAEVLATRRHPEADKLSLCDVSIGKGPVLKIVCGASNVRQGLKVALAQIGAKLPGGLVIKEAKLRGELSQGMLCSSSELGLTDSSEGILELDEDAPLGKDFREYFGLEDVVLDIDMTPNRADCLSVLGIAREVSALTKGALKPIKVNTLQPTIDDKKTVHLQAPLACPKYIGRVIKGLNSEAQTPLWMRERLRRAGVRAKHPVVDVTNYVMLELGQPMHAFDFCKVQGDVNVRMSKEGETLTLLDGQEVTLTGHELLITDEAHPLAIAGVMGGIDSAVNENTCDIFLESAYFSPTSMAGVARRFGLFTDSSQRFERGIDSELQLLAIERASELIIEIAGGSPGPLTTTESQSHLPPKVTVVFNPLKVKQLTGLDIPETTMREMLNGLGLIVKEKANLWEVEIPSYRIDLTLDVDLVEEIIRLYGYDNIVGDKIYADAKIGVIQPIETMSTALTAFFKARGYHETISYSFVCPTFQSMLYPDANPMTLLNPISSELSAMRVSLWPGLIAAMSYNAHRQQAAIKIVESGVIFEKVQDTLKEIPCFAGLLCGKQGEVSWNEETRAFDFFDAKGDLQALFSSLNLKSVQFESFHHSALHPGKSAQIIINGTKAGYCGVLHPKIANALDIQDEIVLFELTLDALLTKTMPRYHAISKFPQIRRDLSLLVNEEISAEQISAVIKEVVEPAWLKSIDIFDLYKGDTIPKAKKSLAIAITLQHSERTLIDNEINELISAIIKLLDERYDITLRD